jgi:hypothetical protein
MEVAFLAVGGQAARLLTWISAWVPYSWTGAV